MGTNRCEGRVSVPSKREVGGMQRRRCVSGTGLDMGLASP